MKKILITYVEAGMGHITTARAVQDVLEKKKIAEKEVDSHKKTIEKVQNDETMDVTGRNLSILFAQQYLEGYEKTLKEINQELAIIDEIKKTFINNPEIEID